jgi:hypothetical protein
MSNATVHGQKMAFFKVMAVVKLRSFFAGSQA